MFLSSSAREAALNQLWSTSSSVETQLRTDLLELGHQLTPELLREVLTSRLAQEWRFTAACQYRLQADQDWGAYS